MKWNTSKGRKFAVVAFWGVETTVDFFDDEADAVKQYEKDEDNGADVFFARVKRMRKAVTPC